MKVTQSDAPCPGCGSPLFQLDGAEGVIAGCDACGGMWLDGTMGLAALTGGLSAGAKRFIEGASQDLKGAPPAGYRAAAPRAERCCPVCRKPLEQRVHAEPRLPIDVCVKHGTYFDLRELQAIVAAVELRHAADGAAAHVAESEAEYQLLQRAAYGDGDNGRTPIVEYLVHLWRKR